MNDRLRKLGKLFWTYKERLILVGMLIYLGMQVYKVLQPTQEERLVLRRPSAELSAEIEGIPKLPPTENPRRRLPGTYSALVNNNPFFAKSLGFGETTTPDTDDWKMEVVKIQEPVPGKPRAQIRTETTTKWYDVGEPFEAYEVQEIDVAGQTCTIYSTLQQKSKVFTVSP